jgi:twitching motility two-component system response regulator PilG
LDETQHNDAGNHAVSASNDAAPHPTLVLDEPTPEGPTVADAAPAAQTHVTASPGEGTCGRPDDTLSAAIAAAQSGNKPLARLHLDQALASDPNNPFGWLWLAWIADSPATAISALEHARPSFSNTSLLDHGLAWARGMQQFKLDAFTTGDGRTDVDGATSVVEDLGCSATAEDQRDGGPSAYEHDGHTTQPLGFAEEQKTAQQPSGGTLPVSELGQQDQKTPDTDDGAGQTLPLENERTADGPLAGRSAEHDGKTLPPGLDVPPNEESGAAPDVGQAAESSANYVGTTVQITGGDMVEILAQVDASRDAGGRGEGDQQASGDKSPSVESSADAPIEPGVDAATDSDQVPEGHPPSASTAAPEPADQPTILAIDDSPTVRSLVSMTLQKCGYDVVTATDGMDALDRLETCTPALILMDINMPRLNGYQLCKLVKKHESMREIPVIMLSGKDGAFDKLRGNLCGCDDYITKPFESVDLIQKVSAFLANTPANA